MRLIDAKQLEKQVTEAFETQNPVLMGQMLRWIRKQKTIDTVPVVRCEKCVAHGNCFAERVFVYTGIENPYCCAGEQKEGAI